MDIWNTIIITAAKLLDNEVLYTRGSWCLVGNFSRNSFNWSPTPVLFTGALPPYPILSLALNSLELTMNSTIFRFLLIFVDIHFLTTYCVFKLFKVVDMSPYNFGHLIRANPRWAQWRLYSLPLAGGSDDPIAHLEISTFIRVHIAPEPKVDFIVGRGHPIDPFFSGRGCTPYIV